MNKSIRIKDIALRAQVSVGTVDRVLHNRGRVSEDALKKVLAVLEEIDYKPNLIARTLGSNKSYRIALVVPDPTQDPYWEAPAEGISQAETEWSRYGFRTEQFLFDQYDNRSFEHAAEAALHSNPDGILIAPLFYRQSLPFFKQLEQQKIPFALFNTNIHEAKPLSFIGQDLNKSGRTAAELMCLGQQESGTFAIVHIHEDIQNSIHILEKEKGFIDYLKERNKDFKTITISLSNPNENSFYNQIASLCSTPGLKGIFVSTSKAFTIGSYLKETRQNNIRLIGYDLIPENLEYLKSGEITFLINQNPKRQAFLGIRCLANHLLFKREIQSIDLLPLEIITAENLQSYLDSEIH
ncbi:MAG: substrate-binding domain-containing protein [Chryseolinea sp.]